MIRQVKLWETCVQLGIVAIAVVVTGDASAKAAPVASEPASTLTSCRSATTVPPTSTQIEALQALMLKYKVATSDSVNKTTMTRCQFASLFSTLEDRVNEIIAPDKLQFVLKEDLLAFQRLHEAYAVELRFFSRFDSPNEARTETLERQVFKQNSPDVQLSAPPTRLACQSFSTTTTLVSSPPFFTGISPCAQQLRPPLASQRSNTVAEGNLPATSQLPPTSEPGSEWTLELLPNGLRLQPLKPNGKPSTAPSDSQALQASVKRYVCIFGFSKSRISEPESIKSVDDRHVCIDQLEEQARGRKQQPFTPTTKLYVETVLELSGTAGGDH